MLNFFCSPNTCFMTGRLNGCIGWTDGMDGIDAKNRAGCIGKYSGMAGLWTDEHYMVLSQGFSLLVCLFVE